MKEYERVSDKDGGRKLIRAVAEELVALLPATRKKRLNLVLTERHIDRLERLRKLVDATSVAEVVRDALFVYETLVEKQISGSSFKELTANNELFPLELGIDVPPRVLRVVDSDPDRSLVKVGRRGKSARTAANR